MILKLTVDILPRLDNQETVIGRIWYENVLVWELLV